jgi:hypothetical protein
MRCTDQCFSKWCKPLAVLYHNEGDEGGAQRACEAAVAAAVAVAAVLFTTLKCAGSGGQLRGRV